MGEYKRNCSICNKELIYKSNVTFKAALKANNSCRSCGRKSEKSQEALRNTIEKNKLKDWTGANNPFYGKKHSPETIEKIKQNGVFLSGKDNPRFGTKNNYELWIEKYGLEEANERQTQMKKKQSINSSGKNNPMYGKPSPKGSGNGWSGWYKGWFFRSLMELAYMVYHIEANNLEWKTGESQSFKIKYVDYLGKTRNYFPDFIIGSEIIEVKPKRLWNTPKVIAKKEGAEQFCINSDFTYKIISCDKLPIKVFALMIEKGEVVLTDRYKEKYRLWKEKQKQ